MCEKDRRTKGRTKEGHLFVCFICLGPLLFILFVNDITEGIPSNVYSGIYADDLKLFACNKDQIRLQEAINNVNEWSKSWNMRFSVAKCSFMQFGQRKTNQIYHLDSVPLNEVEYVRDLGIVMTPNLLFDKHIDIMISKAKSRINNILRCFKCNDVAFLIKAFTVYVRPLLESATEVWNPTAKGLTDNLEKVLRNYTRRVFSRAKMNEAPYKDRLSFLSLQSLEIRRAQRDVIFLFKSIHSLILFDTTTSYKRAPLNRDLRRAHELRLELPFTIRARKRTTFASRSIPIWNKLPIEILTDEDLRAFRKYIESQNKTILLPDIQ